MAKTRDLGVKARASLLERVVDENAGADAQRCELKVMRTGRRSSHGKYCIDSRSAHQRAFAGHIGAADENDSVMAAKSQIVANTARIRKKWMSKAYSFKMGCAGEKLRKTVSGMLEAVGRKRKERLDLAHSREPSGNGTAKASAPRVSDKGKLNGI